MYYAEKCVNGEWWYRSLPDGPWYKFNEGQLKQKITELEKKLQESETEVKRLQLEKIEGGFNS